MKVLPKYRAIALTASNPDKVTALIPGSRHVNVKGNSVVLVHHGDDEVRVLRNMGVAAPPPIWNYYDYPKYEGRHAPFFHQTATSEFLTLHQRCAVLNSQRTGKTMACLWAADWLMREGKVKQVLIVSPLSTLERVWGDAIFSTFYERTFSVLHGDRKTREKLAKQDVDFYIVNHDGFDIVKDILLPKIDLVIYDEAAVLRNPSAKRFKSFNNFMQRSTARLWLLTGTPTPNEPTDAWALSKLLANPNLPRYTYFREMVMEKVGQWAWRPRANSEAIVHQYLQPSIRFSRDDCFDLPETIVETRHCDLTPDQTRLFKQMFREMSMDVKGTEITAVNAAVKIGKLLQLSLGVVLDNAGEEVYVGCEPRIKVILEIIEECDEKVIVFVPFTGSLHAIADAVGKHHSVEIIYGGVTANKRNEIFKNFQHTDSPRVLVADARTMSHGLDLTAATTIIWAAPTYSNEVYEQACARIKGPRQKHKTSIVHIEGSKIEQAVYKRLSDKQHMQDLLLSIIQEQGDVV